MILNKIIKIIALLLWLFALPIVILAVGFAGSDLWSIREIFSDLISLDINFIYRILFFFILILYLYTPIFIWKKI